MMRHILGSKLNLRIVVLAGKESSKKVIFYFRTKIMSRTKIAEIIVETEHTAILKSYGMESTLYSMMKYTFRFEKGIKYGLRLKTDVVNTTSLNVSLFVCKEMFNFNSQRRTVCQSQVFNTRLLSHREKRISLVCCVKEVCNKWI